MSNNFILPPEDYQQIFRTVYSIIDSQFSNTIQSCFYFNTFCAAILEDHYSINVETVCGAAAYKLTPDKPLLLLGSVKNGHFTSDAKGFHCWNEIYGWVLDFMSPLFNDIYCLQHPSISIPSKMFQKKLSDRCVSLEKLKNVGDFLLLKDDSIKSIFLKSDDELDRIAYLIDECVKWYCKPTATMQNIITIRDANNKLKQIHLNQKIIQGTW